MMSLKQSYLNHITVENLKLPDRMLSSVTVRSLATGMLNTGGQSDYC